MCFAAMPLQQETARGGGGSNVRVCVRQNSVLSFFEESVLFDCTSEAKEVRPEYINLNQSFTVRLKFEKLLVIIFASFDDCVLLVAEITVITSSQPSVIFVKFLKCVKQLHISF